MHLLFFIVPAVIVSFSVPLFSGVSSKLGAAIFVLFFPTIATPRRDHPPGKVEEHEPTNCFVRGKQNTLTLFCIKYGQRAAKTFHKGYRSQYATVTLLLSIKSQLTLAKGNKNFV